MDTATAGMWVDRFGLPSGFERRVRVHSRADIAVASGRFPVIVFSHGLSWPSLMYQSYLEDLASRGYVVAAIDHPYGADVVVFPDGRVARYGLWPDGFERDAARDSALAAYVGTWRDDIRYVADVVLDRVGSSGPLRGHLDLSRIGVLGHSYGGSAGALALDDPRIDAGFAMESRVRDSTTRPLTMPGPFMHVVGGYNRREMAGSQYRAGEGPYYEVVVNGMWHAMFSDLIYIYAHYGDSAWQARHRNEIRPRRGLTITRALMTAFFGRYLKDERDPLLHPWWPDEPSNSATSPLPEVEMRIDVP
jgi:dienelactone hydrolase